MAAKILFLHAADARAGSQRVGAQTVGALRKAGLQVRIWLGFGAQGFLCADVGAHPMLPFDDMRLRKLFYPLWIALANLRSLISVLTGEHVWANTVYALPAALAPMLLRPSRLVVHVHELEMPRLYHRLTALAAARGARVIAVSHFHARRLGLPVAVVDNAVGQTPPDASPGRRLVFIGDWRPAKQFDLFVAIAEQVLPLQPRAVLAGREGDYPPALLARARAAGVQLCFGLSDPAVMLEGAALMLQLTDPGQVTETFSLTTAEAVWHLVPVGGAGTEVIGEIAGPALAFNLRSSDPADFAREIRALVADPQRHAALVAACERIRPRFSVGRYAEAVVSLVRPTVALPASP